jgi:hypothetical protein
MKEYKLFSASGEVVSSGGRVISAPPLLQEANITVITESSKIADMIFFIFSFPFTVRNIQRESQG